MSKAVGKWERGESIPDIITFGKHVSVIGVCLNYFGEQIKIIKTEIVRANNRDMSSDTWKEAYIYCLTLGELQVILYQVYKYPWLTRVLEINSELCFCLWGFDIFL